jgi:hypothetical protein
MGYRTCGNGQWGVCEGDKIAITSVGPISIGGLQLQNTPCANDPCNPSCNVAESDAGLDAAGVSATDGGVTIAPTTNCTGLACRVVPCNTPTTLTGTVTDPRGANPIYNAFVYVPNAPLQPFPAGVQADQCGGGGTLSGSPIVVAQTAADGTFSLPNVPAGPNVPLVLQIGHWRREVTIPNVPACASTNANTALGGPSALHLPSKKSEGDMPQMALVTGGCDAFECLLKRIGVDEAEFTSNASAGKVHHYRGLGGAPLASGSQFMDYLFQSQQQLDTYDMVLLPCDCGSEYTAPSYSQTFNVPYNVAQDELVAYANKGGRVFTSHWGRNWIERPGTNAAAPFPNVAIWVCDNCTQYGWVDPIAGYVDTSFAKGAAFNTWLATVGVTNPFGVTPTRVDVVSVIEPTERWVYGWSDNNPGAHPSAPDAVVNMAFPTPVGAPPAQQVGRVVYSDTHVSAQDTNWPWQFPTMCSLSNALTPQEKALEFVFFDLSSCNNPIIVPTYTAPVSFTLDYDATCADTKKLVWRMFDWKAVAPLDSTIAFAVQTADTNGQLGGAETVALGTASVAGTSASASPPAPLSWTGVDVGVKLATIPSTSKTWLRVTVTLNPSTNGMAAPTLSSWRQLYDCLDNQ